MQQHCYEHSSLSQRLPSVIRFFSANLQFDNNTIRLRQGDAGTGSCLALSTLAGISEASLRRVLGAQHLLKARLDMAQLEITEKLVSGL